MDISEVKTNLGKRVLLRNERLLLDGAYILTGCIIRRGEKFGIYYEAELTKDHAVIIAPLGDVFPISTAAVSEKPVSRKTADIASDMLNGCRNRLFITDDPNEIPMLYSGALYHLREILNYARSRLAEKEEQHENDH